MNLRYPSPVSCQPFSTDWVNPLGRDRVPGTIDFDFRGAAISESRVLLAARVV